MMTSGVYERSPSFRATMRAVAAKRGASGFIRPAVTYRVVAGVRLVHEGVNLRAAKSAYRWHLKMTVEPVTLSAGDTITSTNIRL